MGSEITWPTNKITNHFEVLAIWVGVISANPLVRNKKTLDQAVLKPISNYRNAVRNPLLREHAPRPLLEFPLFFDALERDAEAKASAAGRAWASPLAL